MLRWPIIYNRNICSYNIFCTEYIRCMYSLIFKSNLRRKQNNRILKQSIKYDERTILYITQIYIYIYITNIYIYLYILR